MRNVVASALLLLAGCSSTAPSRPANIAQPQIEVRQAGPMFLSQGSTPVSIDVQVTNRADVPLVLREVEISSPDSGQYAITPARRLFEETIAPGETRKVSLSTSAVARNMGAPVGEPVHLRAWVRFEANGKSFREVVITQFAPLS
ncbi:MAG TPA: hypothetical protein VF432_11605 [Thermoanaerobaculia bacterium]